MVEVDPQTDPRVVGDLRIRTDRSTVKVFKELSRLRNTVQLSLEDGNQASEATIGEEFEPRIESFGWDGYRVQFRAGTPRLAVFYPR